MDFERIDLHGIVSVSQVGQILIPKEARDKFEIKYAEKIVVLSHRLHKNVDLILMREFDFNQTKNDNKQQSPGFKHFKTHVEVLGIVKAGKKGQVVIPKEARDKFNIKNNMKYFIIGFNNPDGLYLLILVKPKVMKEIALKILSKMVDYNGEEE